jgi:site-specific DNA recombinase
MTMTSERKVFRCAIYSRKSTEHNLDLEFNSLDAQREACEAYIKSQAHEGWRLVPDRYDDGGLSGASLDRPALQTLLADIRAGKVNTVVVYKVDRLTRSLADFAKLVELFDQHGVSFVSITQSFNTTSSMGRLTLNVLLSFAQFEREVIGERVRDKIAASKRKGLWVGGPVPLGYRSREKKLVIEPSEAETVRLIFQLYLELGSIGALTEELDRRGMRTSGTQGRRHPGGRPLGVGALAYLLKNRVYVGAVVYRGEVHRGEHEPILDRDLFEAVQAKLAEGVVERKARLRTSPAILTGRIFDDRGNRMSPAHANKRGVRYRYYVSQALLQNRRAEAGSVTRVPAPEVEALVLDGIRKHLTSASEPQRSPEAMTDAELIERHVGRVTVRSTALEVCLLSPNQGIGDEEPSPAPVADPTPPGTLTLPWTAANMVATKGIIHAPSAKPGLSRENRNALLTAIARARQWIENMRCGRIASFADIAVREHRDERYIRSLASVAFVSPRIITAIVEGTAPANLTVSGLFKALPYSWAERRIGLTAS